MDKEKIIETLKSEGLDVSDQDHVLMLKAKSQEQIEMFETRISELKYQNSYGYTIKRNDDENPDGQIQDEDSMLSSQTPEDDV